MNDFKLVSFHLTLLCDKCGKSESGSDEYLYKQGWRMKTLHRGPRKGETIYMCNTCTRKWLDGRAKMREKLAKIES